MRSCACPNFRAPQMRKTVLRMGKLAKQVVMKSRNLIVYHDSLLTYLNISTMVFSLQKVPGVGCELQIKQVVFHMLLKTCCVSGRR